MTAKQVARLTGISVRTLHHYDQIGLLTPARQAGNRYRQYTENDLDRLQQILFFKTCGFPLSQIQALLNRPDYNQDEAFELQRRYLLRERARIDTMLDTLEKTRRSRKGELHMSTQEKFKGFDFTHNPYEQEARERWGDTTVEQSKTFLEGKSTNEQQEMGEQMDALFRSLAALRTQDPASAPAQDAMADMFRFFNSSFGVTYTPEAFAGIGQMYVEDERFLQNIDRYGEGLAAFLAKAMGIYAAGLQSRDS